MPHTEHPASRSQKMEQDSDAAALARYGAGDDAGLVLLVRRHERVLRRVAWQVVRDAAEAEDVVQSAWIAAINGAAGFQGGSAVSTWLARIERNQALDRLRRRAARPRLAVRIDDVASSWAVVSSTNQMAAAQGEMIVLDLLAELPPTQRGAIVLVDLHELSIDEAAKVLNVDAAGVQVAALGPAAPAGAAPRAAVLAPRALAGRAAKRTQRSGQTMT